MFCFCEKFNQPLDKWDVSNVRHMKDMFYRCDSFNQSLKSWKLNILNFDNVPFR